MKIVVINRVQMADRLVPAKTPGADPLPECTTPDGVVHRGNGCCYDAARHLISKGVDPKSRMKVYRGDLVCLTGTVHSFARVMYGGPSKDPYTVPYRRHFQAAPMAAPLAAWYEALIATTT